MMKLIQNNKKLITGKLLYDNNIPANAVFKSRLALLKEELSKENIIKLALADKNNLIKGVLIIENSEWDSEHFEFGIGKSRLVLFDADQYVLKRQKLIREVLKICASEGLRLVFARITLNDLPTIHAFEGEGAIITDILATFHIDLKRCIIPNHEVPGVEIEEAGKSDAQAISEISRKAFRVDHYHSDCKLAKDKCDELYAKWSLNCLNGLSDAVLVATRNSETAGFITCKIERVSSDFSYGDIDLIAVSDSYQGKGIGCLLIIKALDWFSKYTKSVYVGTQVTNIPAVRLYERIGFKAVFAEATLHLWTT